MTAWGVVAVCAAGGAAAGPFLDVLARRVRRPDPVAGSEGSGSVLPETSAVPVVTGRPGAGWPLAVEAPVASLVAGALFALAAVRLGAVPVLAAYCVLFAGLLAVSITDLRTGLVPRRFVYLTLALLAVALVAACAVDGRWRPLLDALIGGAAGFVVLGAVWWIYPKGMGFGDVRLAGLCGAGLGWLGFAPVYLGFLAGFVTGALAGLVVLAARGRRRFPFAPALAAGTAFGVLWGQWLGNLWLHPG